MSIDPGDGYRLLEAGEVKRAGDQLFPIGGVSWTTIHSSQVGRKHSRVEVPYRRKIESPTGTESQVCADIAARQRAGIAKYGTTVKDNPLSHKEWLQHAYEECLDQAVYLRRAIDELG